MTDVTRIGLDLAKSIFQIHGVNADEVVTIRRSLRRGQMLAWFAKLPPCLIGMEACAGAHYWARELSQLGHTVRLMPPLYVKGYQRRNKTDAADAAAICEAVSRPSMRFVTPKTAPQQAAAGIHRVRASLTKQETMTMNSLRGLMAEFGIIAPQGRKGIAELLAILNDPQDTRIPQPLHGALQALAATLRSLAAQLKAVDKALAAWGRADTTSRHLSTIPGFGVVTATAIAAHVPDPSVFASGRDFSASIGVVPRQNGTGGKVRLGAISKKGSHYLRRLSVNGAMSYLRSKRGRQDPWVVKMLARKPMKLVAVALANKNLRIAWALMVRGEDYRAATVAAA
ncbi:MAG TPA: IS110 family transposase [Rhodopila sp.]|jgi:transposase|nr:IS110 family transposase [Rhodopila sp.]